MKSKKILLVCYSFPPYPGIGGRRWAKFAKYLAKDEYEIYVLCAKFSGNKSSEWTQDVTHSNIKIFPCNTKIPKVFDKPIVNFVDKALYRFWKYYSKILSKGRIYDKAFFWKKDLIRKAEELITVYNIKNVVCTIPPYRLAYYMGIVKERNPHIHFILDYRDPWTDNETFHEFATLSQKRKEYERKMETFSINKADVVLSSTDQMTIWNKQKSLQAEKCVTITNGFDSEDVLKIDSIEGNEKYTFLFAGNLYDAIDYVFLPFIDYLKKKESNEPDFKNKFSFKFYGHIPNKYSERVKNAGVSSFEFHDFIPLSDLKKEYVKANCFMMFTVKDHAFAFNTKFYEYISYRKPILHFSNDGEVSNFIEGNKIGVGLSPNNLEKKLSDTFALIKNDTFTFNPKFDSQEFDIKNITQKLKQVFV